MKLSRALALGSNSINGLAQKAYYRFEGSRIYADPVLTALIGLGPSKFDLDYLRRVSMQPALACQVVLRQALKHWPHLGQRAPAGLARRLGVTPALSLIGAVTAAADAGADIADIVAAAAESGL